MRKALFLSLIALGTACSAAAVVAQSDSFAALTSLERGEWELTGRGNTATPRRLCLGDVAQLLQPNHPGRQCKRFVVENSASNVAVTYDCAQAGQGRTALRVETARLVQIDSQGVSGGLPFALNLEGRHVGTCKRASLQK